MSFTEQQTTAISSISSGASFAMRAVAGSGKTTTLVAGMKQTKRSGIALAFNKRNAEDLALKLGPASSIEAKTMNALGHRVWSTHLNRRLSVSMDKLRFLIKEANWKLEPDEWRALTRMVSLAKARGITPGILEQPLPDIQNWADGFDEIDGDMDLFYGLLDQAVDLLQRSVNAAWKGNIDFDDQLYMPIIFQSPFPSFPFVAVDEAQDLSPLQHEMVNRLRAKQLVVVGDPNQAIYAFRGADSSSFEALIHRFTLHEVPLTVSFRCPQLIGAIARDYVPDFTCFHSNPDGNLHHLSEPPFRGTIICRFNAPLVKHAFAAIQRGIPVNFLGRDFLAGLKALHKKHPTLPSLETWLKEKLSQAKTDGAKQKTQDQFNSLRILHESTKDVAKALDNLSQESKMGNAITLSSVHKAKGMEWREVTFLSYDPDRDGGQERNINYVGVTRTMDTLNLIPPPRRY